MKRILIIGENSYIGKSFGTFANDKYNIKIVSSRNSAWKNTDFTEYDSVLYCAGIAHSKQTNEMKTLYYAVNCDLTIDIARKAKNEGVSQFIFLSSMAVYGTTHPEIDKGILPQPASNDFYGGSKLKAEYELKKLFGDNLKLCIVRPPMVYGKGCKGNFPKLVNLVKRMLIFPDYLNKRSMIYIDNLCEFLCNIIDSENEGVFTPQNDEYVNTTELVRYIAECHNKRIVQTKLFNIVIRLFMKRMSIIKKMFGDLYYHRQGNENGYNIVSFKESIKKSME